MLKAYGMSSKFLKVFYDNLCAIEVSKNFVQHSHTICIDIRHHFIRYLVEQELICIKCISTEKRKVDIFTKAIGFERFSHLRKSPCLCTP